MRGERAYIYAKSCGMIAKSFVEGRVNRLSAISSIEVLEDLVFGLVDSAENIDDIEKRLAQREHEAIAKIMKSFSRPPKLLSLLIESDSPAAHPADKKNAPSADIAEITRQNNQYYTALWQELEKVPLSDRKLITPLIADEIRLKNAVWALRLRVYYLMPPDQIKDFLVAIKPGTNQRPLHDDALKSLEPDIEEESQWHAWRLWKFANKTVSGQYWKIDPRYFQNQASLHLYRLARKGLRKSPFTLDTACCFIKLKQFEKEILTSVAEAARLGLTGGDALEILGLSRKVA